MSGVDREPLRDTLLQYHPLARSRTGFLTGCRCGEVQLGEDVIQHVMEKLLGGPLAPWLDASFAVERAQALIDGRVHLGPTRLDQLRTILRVALDGGQR